MKKLIALLVAATFGMGSVSVFAADDMSKDSAAPAKTTKSAPKHKTTKKKAPKKTEEKKAE